MDTFIITPEILIILPIVSFIAGFIDAIVGGGGLLTTPALLTAGLPPYLVLGTNKFSATFGSSTASITFYKRKIFKIKDWYPAFITMAVGAGIGAYVAHYLSPEFLNMVLPIIVFICGLYFLFSKIPDKAVVHNETIPKGRQWPQGILLGFYDGVAGPGTGAFAMVSTLLMYPVDLLRATGVARGMNFASNLAALIVFAIHGQIAWLLGACMGVAMMLGSYLGSRSAISGGSKFIRPMFIFIVMCMTVRLIWKSWF